MLNLIACIDKHNSIGINNDLIYKFPEDLKIFKEKTLNKTVVMGRRTFESLKNIPLSNRKNIIVSSTLSNPLDGSYSIVKNINSIIHMSQGEEMFVIGGKKIYEYFNEHYDEIHLTKVKNAFTKSYETNRSIKLNISLDGFKLISKLEFEKFNIYIYKRSS